MNFENLGFCFQTSGLELHPTFSQGSEAQGIYIYFFFFFVLSFQDGLDMQNIRICLVDTASASASSGFGLGRC